MKSLKILIPLIFSSLMLASFSAEAQRCEVPNRPRPRGTFNQGPYYYPTYTYGATPGRAVYNNNGPALTRRRMPNRADFVGFRGQRFYYLDGEFYQRARNGRGFVLVRPPVGITINRRPYRMERVRFRGQWYYQSGIYWYAKNRNRSGFTLIRPPFARR
ncbi:MAG: DUF6515 family protein [Bacteroidota bacterium]